MDFFIWIITIVLATNSLIVFGQVAQPDVQLPSLDSVQLEFFKKFLQKSLSSDGVYYRYILVSTGIFPPPPNPAQLRENDAEMSFEQPPFEFYEHFKHYAQEILASEEKINEAIFKLVSVEALKATDFETTNSFLFSDLTTKMTLPDSAEDITQPGWLSSYSSDVDIINLDSDQQVVFKNTQYEVVSEASSNSIETSASPEAVSFTTDYIKFLTEEKPIQIDKLNIDKLDADQCTTGTVFLDNDFSSVSHTTEGYTQYLRDSSDPITSTQLAETDGTEPTEDYSTSFFSTMNNAEESYSSSEYDSEVSQKPTDYISLKLWPTRPETIEKMQSLSNEHSTPMSQSKIYEDMTENQKIESQTTESETIYESRQTESEETSSPSLRVAKEIRHNESESSRIDLIRGTPGIQYPNYEDIPDSEFNCKDKMHIPGFYADMETRCQVFHVCWPGRRESFLCPIGTIFNQAILACDYWYNSNCSVSSAYFDVNVAFKEVDTTKSGMTGPMVDTLIKDTKKTPAVPDEIISSSGEISELYEADVHFSETVAKHELSKIWKFLPIKAKIFIQPQLKLEDIIGKTKLKRSKKGIEDERDVTNGRRDDASEIRKQSEEKIETVLLEVLKNIIQ